MAMYTNLGLVEHAKTALKLDTKYMWGGILRLIEKCYDQLKDYYGNLAGTGYTNARWAELKRLMGKNVYGCDCVGLIKSYYWSGKQNGGTGSPNYGQAGFPDVNANLMYNAAKVKGKISTMPEVPGLIVYCKTHPHVGVYIGDGWVIESTLGARGDGVVRTRLDAFGWEYWMECPYIEYVKQSTSAVTFKTNDKVQIKKTATNYAGAGKNVKIPSYVKNKTFTIINVKGDMSLIKEIYSWVNNSDLVKV